MKNHFLYLRSGEQWAQAPQKYIQLQISFLSTSELFIYIGHVAEGSASWNSDYQLVLLLVAVTRKYRKPFNVWFSFFTTIVIPKCRMNCGPIFLKRRKFCFEAPGGLNFGLRKKWLVILNVFVRDFYRFPLTFYHSQFRSQQGIISPTTMWGNDPEAGMPNPHRSRHSRGNIVLEAGSGMLSRIRSRRRSRGIFFRRQEFGAGTRCWSCRSQSIFAEPGPLGHFIRSWGAGASLLSRSRSRKKFLVSHQCSICISFESKLSTMFAIARLTKAVILSSQMVGNRKF